MKKLYEQSTIEQQTEGEPFLYIRDREDGLSLEIPEKTMIRFVKRLTDLLSPKKITIRYITDDKKVEKRCNRNEFPEVLTEIQVILLDNSVILKFDHHTLYSNSGGCMLLETTMGLELKKTIANFLLKINGCPEWELKDNFTIMIRADKDNGGSLEKVE